MRGADINDSVGYLNGSKHAILITGGTYDTPFLIKGGTASILGELLPSFNRNYKYTG